MAIGTTGTYDPTTGERRETQFSYTPVDPQEDMMRQAFQQSQQAFYPPPPQPQGPTPYWENPATYYPRQEQADPVAQAKAATAAAYKYIAFRGYQNDLKNGMSAADAFAKWGPMLVQDVSLAPTLKALTPTPQPTWMPANAATGQPGTWVNGRVTVPQVQGKETVVQPTGSMPGYIRDAKGGIHFAPAEKPDPFAKADYDRVAEDYEAASKVYGDPSFSEADRKEAIQRMATAQRRMESMRKGTPTNPTAIPKGAVKEIIRLTRDGKKAVFDAVTKQFIRYAE